MEDAFTQEYFTLLRAEFPFLSDAEYATMSVGDLQESIGHERVIRLAERASKKVDVQPGQVQASFLSFKCIPLNVLALILRNINYNSIRALCLVEKHVRKNCWKLIDKIGSWRHGAEWMRFVQRHGAEKVSLHPVQWIQALELAHIVIDADTSDDIQIAFYKKDELVLTLQSSYGLAIYTHGSFEKRQDMQYVIEQSGIPLAKYVDKTYFPIDPIIRVRQNYYLMENLIATLLIGEGLIVSQRDFPSWFMSDNTLQQPQYQHIAACGACGNHATQTCGGCKAVMYCSTQCQSSDWPLHQHVCDE